jgi:hypothetical protein
VFRPCQSHHHPSLWSAQRAGERRGRRPAHRHPRSPAPALLAGSTPRSCSEQATFLTRDAPAVVRCLAPVCVHAALTICLATSPGVSTVGYCTHRCPVIAAGRPNAAPPRPPTRAPCVVDLPHLDAAGRPTVFDVPGPLLPPRIRSDRRAANAAVSSRERANASQRSARLQSWAATSMHGLALDRHQSMI